MLCQTVLFLNGHFICEDQPVSCVCLSFTSWGEVYLLTFWLPVPYFIDKIGKNNGKKTERGISRKWVRKLFFSSFLPLLLRSLQSRLFCQHSAAGTRCNRDMKSLICLSLQQKCQRIVKSVVGFTMQRNLAKEKSKCAAEDNSATQISSAPHKDVWIELWLGFLTKPVALLLPLTFPLSPLFPECNGKMGKVAQAPLDGRCYWQRDWQLHS